jgi:serine protease
MVKRDVRRRGRPVKPSRSNEQDMSGYRPRVVVKFRDFLELPYEDGIEDYIQRYQIGPWDRLVEEFPGITLRRLYTTTEPEKIRALVDKATELDRTYHPPNLLTYFMIDCPLGVDPQSLADALSAWETVQTAYVEIRPILPYPCATSDDPRFKSQGYLKKAPEGIDAEYAWKFPEGCGKGIQFVDIEYGWMLNHEDLIDAKIKLIHGINKTGKDYIDHGTAVLGIVGGVDNKKGGIGIAPSATAKVASIYKTSTNWNTADAILKVVSLLNFGDVLLLELQTAQYEPIETGLANFDAVRLGTALGIVIVEPAGNGSMDLDKFKDLSGKLILNRDSKDFKDSGTIMVAAVKVSKIPHEPLLGIVGYGTNTGNRIDCYAWGIYIDTCWCDANGTKSQYTSNFGGTSGASAIIAGAALVVQGIAEAKLKYRFSGWQLREILSDPANGTSPATPMIGSYGLGIMPDLKKIISNKTISVAPDVYIRDFVGDTGDPHKGALAASPDIILRPAKVTNPQASFGEGSKTENTNTLGHQAKTGQDNFVYVRVRNRGGSAAKNVSATVYWSPVATLVTPFLWTRVDPTKSPKTPDITIPNVPTGDQLTVSAPITWKAANIPASGHYCFVGLVGNEEDPAPVPPDFIDWNKFRRFIRENNNVTWRNFNVVPNKPKPPKPPSPIPRYDVVTLPFLASGAPDMARLFQLEVVARLPEKTRVWLEAPMYFIDAMQVRSPFLRRDEKRDVAWVPLNPHGHTVIGEALFPPDSLTELRLLVHIPDKWRKSDYEVYVSQLYKDEEEEGVKEYEEVGRITWLLVPQEHLKKE